MTLSRKLEPLQYYKYAESFYHCFMHVWHDFWCLKRNRTTNATRMVSPKNYDLQDLPRKWLYFVNFDRYNILNMRNRFITVLSTYDMISGVWNVLRLLQNYILSKKSRDLFLPHKISAFLHNTWRYGNINSSSLLSVTFPLRNMFFDLLESSLVVSHFQL